MAFPFWNLCLLLLPSLLSGSSLLPCFFALFNISSSSHSSSLVCKFVLESCFGLFLRLRVSSAVLTLALPSAFEAASFFPRVVCCYQIGPHVPVRIWEIRGGSLAFGVIKIFSPSLCYYTHSYWYLGFHCCEWFPMPPLGYIGGGGGAGFRDSFYVHLVTLVHLITMPQSHPLPMVISNPHNHSQKQEGSFFKPIVYMEKLNLGKSKKLKQILKNRKGQKHDLNSGLSDSQTHVLSTTRISPLFIWRRTTPHSSIY